MAKRSTLGQTRERVLAAALEMLAEAEVNFDPSAIGLIDACRHAGLHTAGSGYKIWESQQDFRADLMRYAVAHHEAVDERLARLEAWPTDRVSGADRTEQIRLGALATGNSADTSTELARQTALWLRARRDTEVRKGFAESERALIAGIADAYRRTMMAFDREMVPPYTVEQLALAVEAATRGLATMTAFGDEFGATHIERPTGPDGESQQWNLLGCVLEALTTSFTRPRKASGAAASDP